MRNLPIAAAAVAVLLLPAPFGALAQEGDRSAEADETNRLETIVVTARQREEASRDVPFALTVLGGDTLEARRVDDTSSLFRQAPGLSLTSFDDGRFAYFQLRGIGPLSQAIGPDDGSVVTYVDGVPQPVFASEFAYLDLERIEVLRGPQGTLFGRNSQGGAINITTRAPADSREARVRVEGAEQGFGLAEASISGPLADERFRGRLSFRASTVDGFIDNIAPRGGDLGDRTAYSGRGILAIEPETDDGPRITLSANADHRVSNPFYYVLRTQSEPVVEIDPENEVERTAWGASVMVEKPLRFAEFTSITAINGFGNDQVTDDTDGLIYGPLFGLPASAFLAPLSFSDWSEDETRFFQEFRLSSFADDAIAWAAGLVYFQSDLEVALDNRSAFSPILNGDRDATQKIDSYAAYGEVTASLFSPRFRGTAGFRHTRDEKTLDASFAGVGFPGSVAFFEEDSEADFDLFTGRLALVFEATRNVNLYATVGRGAKSGGFPRLTLNAAFGVASPNYAESSSWTYEAGVKADLLEGRASLAVSGFYNDVEDEQLFVLDFVAFQFVPVNLDTRSRGVEAQGEVALSRNWSLSGGLAWTDGEIREADAFSGAAAGNPIPNVPRLSTTATVDYRGGATTWGGDAWSPFMTLTHQYVSERGADVADSFDLDGYHNVDFRIGAAFGRVEGFVFARNVLDEDQEINGVLYGPGVEGVSLSRGRVVGMGLASTF
ncbi:MAG: TonB-dependent receptor [Gammaproteobacteria bacterium]|nr:TonB-dependent receptor [Gammaproteobacteria bacterium]